jgi:hypothetical protein
MAKSTFDKALGTVDELTITVTGRQSGRKVSLPVWFVLDGQTLHLLPVTGSDSQWYRNVRKTPMIRLAARRSAIRAKARPITSAAQVRKIVGQFRAKYGAGDVKKYYTKFDVAVDVRLPSLPAPNLAASKGKSRAARQAARRGSAGNRAAGSRPGDT